MTLFKNRTFTLAVIGSISVGVAMFGTTVYLAQYMQLARGATPTQSGLLTHPDDRRPPDLVHRRRTAHHPLRQVEAVS